MPNNKDQLELDRFDLDSYKEYYEEGTEKTIIPEVPKTKSRSSRKKLLLFSPLLFVIVGASYFSWKPMSSAELVNTSRSKEKGNIKTIALSEKAANTIVASESATESVEDIAAIVEIVMAKIDQDTNTQSADTEPASHTLAANEEEHSSEEKLTRILLDTEEALASSSPDDDLALSEQTEKIRAVSDAAVVAYNEVVTKPKAISREHQVKHGDTFFSIARSHDTTVSKITSYNHMKKDATLKIGNILKIPPKGYVPQKSDSRSFASVSKVKAAEKKKVQLAKTVKTVKAKKIASAPKKVLKKRHTVAKNDTYKVKKGDTLYLIAERYHVSSRALKKFNKIKSSKSLRLGQVLTIPGKPGHIKTKHKLAKNKTTLKKRLASSHITFSKKSAHKLKKSKINFFSLTSGSSKSHLKLGAAKKQLGKRYVWGATGPYNFDCSGFTRYVCKKSGVCIPRTSRNQAKVGKRISRNNLKAGDLIFFDTSKERKGYVNHVGIYLGHNKFIHASSAKKKVVITSLNKPFYRARFKWGSRVKG